MWRAITARAACSLLVATAACAGSGAAESTDGPEKAATPAATGSAAAAGTGSTVAAADDQALQKQFPPQDHLNKIVAAYTVANEYPEVLTGLPCYCPCELYGHGGVIDCHRSQHAAMCNVCMDEAIEAGTLYEVQVERGAADISAVQASVKGRYRQALIAQTAQQMPGANTAPGQAYLMVCSDCHQPPSPAMHAAIDWDASLARMEQYGRQRNTPHTAQQWDLAASFVKSTAGRFPDSTITEVRQGLQGTVEYLKETEGDAAYYPSVRDRVLDIAWAERMVAAYDAARELPVELLAQTTTSCKACLDAGHTSLLECLNSGHAITCETAVDEVHTLAAEHQQYRLAPARQRARVRTRRASCACVPTPTRKAGSEVPQAPRGRGRAVGIEKNRTPKGKRNEVIARPRAC